MMLIFFPLRQTMLQQMKMVMPQLLMSAPEYYSKTLRSKGDSENKADGNILLHGWLDAGFNLFMG